MGRKRKHPWAVFLAIALAILTGPLVGKTAGLFGITFYSLFDLLGTLFINSLIMIVVPLVSSSIITGLAKLGSEGVLGRLGLKTFIFYFGSNFLAIVVGMAVANLIAPGSYLTHNAQLLESLPSSPIPEHVTAAHESVLSISALILEIVPSNVVEAFASGQMLAVIFFSILFGYAISKLKDQPAAVLMNLWQGIFEAMIQITHLIMKVLPYGVFCLVAKVFATTGWESLASLGVFFVTVLMGLSIFVFGVLPLALKWIGKVDPFLHFRAMAPALITAFSTSSSSAALPITIECAEKRAGISNRICGLVIPLGCSVNLSGSALYECVAALFVAQAYGLELGLAKQFVVLFVALIASIGVAGVPSGSLVAIIVIMKALGLPPEGIGLFIAVDRILDMCRTTVNVFSDSCCAVLVAKTEGETEVLTRRVFEE